MNFTSPFVTGTTFTTGTLQAGHQFTTAKFAQQVGTTAGGQVLGLLSSDDQGITYLRPVDNNGTFALTLPQTSGNSSQQQIIALPVSLQTKPGEVAQQQTLQIQVVNPANTATSGGDKYSLPLSLQHFQQGQGCENIVVGVIDPNSLSSSGGLKMITLAYNPAQGGAEGLQLQLQQTDENGDVQDMTEQEQMQEQHNNNNNNPSVVTQGMNVDEMVSLMPMVLPDVKPMLGDGDGGQAYPVAVVTSIPQELMSMRAEDMEVDKDGQPKDKDKQDNEEGKVITVDCAGETYTAWQPNSAVADYFNRLGGQHPLNIHHFLKFSAETIKREQAIESSPLSATAEGEESTVDMQQTQEEHVDDPTNPEAKMKKKKKYKKKAPKPRRPRPGQVHIATALDGTTLFCCPECNMAYPDKELLEQHLVAHKIERRFICDICGAGLKRKEHLERHKLGHNPERPYICSVCCKGFKRKEHLNLHFVIHSGEKTEVCPECGKGFYRKDHLRKHARSHLAKRVKDELQQAGAGPVLQPEEENVTVVLPTAAETHPVALTTIHHPQQ